MSCISSRPCRLHLSAANFSQSTLLPTCALSPSVPCHRQSGACALPPPWPFPSSARPHAWPCRPGLRAHATLTNQSGLGTGTAEIAIILGKMTNTTLSREHGRKWWGHYKLYCIITKFVRKSSPDHLKIPGGKRLLTFSALAAAVPVVSRSNKRECSSFTAAKVAVRFSSR